MMGAQQPAARSVTFGGCVINAIGIMFFLVGVTITVPVYQALVQRPLCYDYAARKQLPDREFLVYSGVVMRSNQFQGHVCLFTDTRNGFPISLRFDEADIPSRTDTTNVLVMIAGGVLFYGAYVALLALLQPVGRWLGKAVRP